jgi:hypothetical protein
VPDQRAETALLRGKCPRGEEPRRAGPMTPTLKLNVPPCWIHMLRPCCLTAAGSPAPGFYRCPLLAQGESGQRTKGAQQEEGTPGTVGLIRTAHGRSARKTMLRVDKSRVLCRCTLLLRCCVGLLVRRNPSETDRMLWPANACGAVDRCFCLRLERARNYRHARANSRWDM